MKRLFAKLHHRYSQRHNQHHHHRQRARAIPVLMHEREMLRACVLGCPTHREMFLAQYGGTLQRVIERLTPHISTEQTLRHVVSWLFDGPHPKILEHTGEQPLARWLRAATARYLITRREDVP